MNWPDPDSIQNISAHQRGQLTRAFRSNIAILAGTPGTGKTHTGMQVIRGLLEIFPPGLIAVCAPTGKAAVRCTEVMDANGIHLRASTFHSLLVPVQGGDGSDWMFEHGPENKLPHRAIVIDEASMGCVPMMSALFSAIQPGTLVLVVGDPYQLPPVQHGAPLRDMIAAGVPYGELTEIWRNEGGVVAACKRIKDGKPIAMPQKVNISAGENFAFRATRGDSETARIIESMLVSPPPGRDAIWDFQVVVATNEKSNVSRVAMNERLQGALNSQGEPVIKTSLRVGDKVICTENTWLQTADESSEVYVANGELGQVVYADEDQYLVKLRAPERTVVGSLKSHTKLFDLGYALTCHKMQGSSAPVIIMAIDPHARQVCSREWLYTALSRTEELCIGVGDWASINKMIGKSQLATRKTFLSSLIAG